MTGWKKVLYEKNNFPDDYVPDTFLEDLRKNVNVRHFNLQDCITASFRITIQVCLIVHLLLVFHFLSLNDELTTLVVWIAVAVLTLFLGLLLASGSKSEEAMKLASSSLMCLVAGVTVAPILKTLTETISTDTVYSMVTIMLVVHLFSFDFGMSAWIVSPVVSTNAVTFAGVCLASRLSTSSAFILLILVSDLFVLLNLLRIRYESHTTSRVTVAWTLILVTSSYSGLILSKPLLWPVSFTILLLLLNLIFPFIFFRLQEMKENIYGPWDEAIIGRQENQLK